MNRRAIESVTFLVDTILTSHSPDMTRLDEVTEVRRSAYSESRLRDMFPDAAVDAACQVFEGVPMWAEAVRALMIGWFVASVRP